jgi:hypothetical protein
MKIKEILMLTIAAMIAMGSLAYAQDNNAGTEPAAAQDNNAGTESVAGQSVSQIQAHGVVEKTDHGVTLFDGKTTYLLKSENDLDSFAGKSVTVAGHGYTSDTGMVILVNQIVEFN